MICTVDDLLNTGPSGFEEHEDKEAELEDEFLRNHHANKYLIERGYNRRFGIIVYETIVGALAFVGLILNVIDTESVLRLLLFFRLV